MDSQPFNCKPLQFKKLSEVTSLGLPNVSLKYRSRRFAALVISPDAGKYPGRGEVSPPCKELHNSSIKITFWNMKNLRKPHGAIL